MEKIFIINLETECKKQNEMKEKLLQANIADYEFVKAVDGRNELNKYEFNLISNWYDIKKQRKITVGEIGCALSHYFIWKKMVDNNIQRALILEDDVLFDDSFDEMYKFVKNVSIDYDLLYLGRIAHFENSEIKINSKLLKPKYSYGTYAYILTYSGAVKLTSCNFLNNILPVDEFLPIMYDDNYPYKNYAVFFENFEKLHALALNKNTINVDFSHKSTTDNFELYNEKKHNTLQTEVVNSWMLKNDVSLVQEGYLFECMKNIKQGTFLLNKNILSRDILEQYVYELCKFHIHRLEKSEDEVEIEFWYKSNDKTQYNTRLHIDCDEKEETGLQKIKNTPFLSLITYFNNNENTPTIITNINKDEYMFKEFDNDINLCFSFPQKNKHVSFEGGKYYHGYCNFINEIDKTERDVLVINLWKKKPTNIPFYNSFSQMSIGKIGLQFEKMENNTIIVDNIDNHFLQTICYKEKMYIDNLFGEYAKKVKAFGKILNKTYIFKNEQKCNEICPEKIFDKKFNQRFRFNKHFTKDTCIWLILESEEYAKNNGGWTKNRHKYHPTTDLPLLHIPSINRFLITSFKETILNLINQSYQIEQGKILNIVDLFIVKYEIGGQESLELHRDGNDITVNIMLSHVNDFEGGGTYFDDGLTTFLEQGDLLIHSGKTLHSGIKITSGKRYIIVFFINIV